MTKELIHAGQYRKFSRFDEIITLCSIEKTIKSPITTMEADKVTCPKCIEVINYWRDFWKTEKGIVP